MKNIARNKLAYVGTVTLSQYIGSKKIILGQIHNSGNTPLFDFFVSCLTGDFVTAQALLPRRIGLFTAKVTANDGLEITGGVGNWPLLSPAKKVNSTADNSAVRYSFSIPFEVISPMTSFTDAYVGLYREDAFTQKSPDEDLDEKYEDYMAYFSLETLPRGIFLNAALVVDWELQVINGKTDYGSASSSK